MQEKIPPIKIDAKDKVLGRLATQIATYLQCKHRADYAPHKDIPVEVIVENVGSIVVTGNKATQKTYYRHSGYPGGLYERTYEEQFNIDPTQVLRRAVWGMLPNNKLRSKRIKRLTFNNGN